MNFDHEVNMDSTIVAVISGLGILALIGVFKQMKGGFGPFNLRALGIVLVAVLASLLAMKDGGSITAAMGILGAIVGYLFGIKDNKTQGSNDS
jgi:hypothetical protein